MNKLLIAAITFGLGCVTGMFYFAVTSNEAHSIRLIDSEECYLTHFEVALDGKKIVSYQKDSMHPKDLSVQFLNPGYPYTYKLYINSVNCGQIETEPRKIEYGHIFYENVYKSKVSHRVRA